MIAATGFRTGLEQLIDLPGALDSRGEPAFPSGRPTAFPGLYFIGYTHSLRGHLFEANRDSRRLAKTIGAYLAGKCSHLPYRHFYGIYERMMLEEEVERLRTENQELKQQVAHLLEQLAAAQQRIAELEQQHSTLRPSSSPIVPNRPNPNPSARSARRTTITAASA